MNICSKPFISTVFALKVFGSIRSTNVIAFTIGLVYFFLTVKLFKMVADLHTRLVFRLHIESQMVDYIIFFIPGIVGLSVIASSVPWTILILKSTISNFFKSDPNMWDQYPYFKNIIFLQMLVCKKIRISYDLQSKHNLHIALTSKLPVEIIMKIEELLSIPVVENCQNYKISVEEETRFLQRSFEPFLAPEYLVISHKSSSLTLFCLNQELFAISFFLSSYISIMAFIFQL